MKIVIVGCGWLGKLVAVPLVAAGYDVYGSCRSQERAALLPAGVKPVILNLAASTHIENKDISNFENAVIVCAIPPGKTSDSQYLLSLSALVNVMQKAGSLGCIHFSSTGVYQGLSGNVTEDAELDYTNERVRLLFDGEQCLRQFKPCTTLRLAGLMGPGRHPGRFSVGKVLPNPDGAVNMIHAADVSGVVKKLLSQPLQQVVYNLSYPNAVNRQHFYTAAYALIQTTAPVFASSSADSRRVMADKICQQTGYQYLYQTAIAALADC